MGLPDSDEDEGGMVDSDEWMSLAWGESSSSSSRWSLLLSSAIRSEGQGSRQAGHLTHVDRAERNASKGGAPTPNARSSWTQRVDRQCRE